MDDKSDTYSSSLEYSTSETTCTSETEQQNLDLIGDTINNYNIISELGSGAYSRVWLAYNISDEKYYAVKVQNSDDYIDGKDEINILKKIGNRCQYINRLIDTFVESRFIDSKIEKFACSVFELCGCNLD